MPNRKLYEGNPVEVVGEVKEGEEGYLVGQEGQTRIKLGDGTTKVVPTAQLTDAPDAGASGPRT